ncbi:esterase-like activity of phytase family protein [Cereibacter changlensis]|uniref:Esterase-like activity of phytase family protein n=1 Tax=Cereibacter changlensis TaxID=402884 RepID=A0A4U0Z4B5_9RHOB|nr:esterase-like activity of phytase family protein [Cereibacter changlensis]TKA97331.1 esterase-like activity of phytase family protein [Cereibacter changlensis]
MPTRFICLTSVLALTAGTASAEMHFNRVSSFATPLNMAADEDAARTSSAEIISASGDGMTLVYTDSPLGVIGLIDITDPKAPKPLGNVDMGGEPTAVSVIGNTAYVAVNTSESFTNPSGVLRAVDLATKEITASCDLGGQPDSTAAAKDGSFLSIAIENERDEDAGDGRVGQMPAGFLVQLPLTDGAPDCAALRKVELTGLTDISPEDPEPEFADINGLGETVLTLQENNHIAVIAADGTVSAHFSAGSVDLTGIDATDEKAALRFDESQEGQLREPDGVQWLDDETFVLANEGDMDGGARGFTVMKKDGTVLYESGADFEQAVARVGHYPDRRSDAKGVEPEGMEFARFGDVPMMFLLAERASVVGVYDMTDPASPALKQILPSGISPEGAVAIPQRNLIATANEVDLVEDGGVRAHVMLYEYQDAPASYPQLVSADDQLIGWGAISGMAAGEDGTIYAVNDSFYGFQPTIFEIDASQTPAVIVKATPITRGGAAAQMLDIEGITLDGEGGFWLASEGNDAKLLPHGLYHVNAEGEIEEQVALPADLLAGATRFGFEGIAKVGNTLWMPVQREWKDDPKGMVKLMAYDLESEEWGAVHYPLEASETGWVGLSELTVQGDNAYLIERDNQIGSAAKLKQITRVSLAEMKPAPLGGELPVVTKEVVRDLIPDLAANGGYVVDKIEGLAIAGDGTVWVSTDNDGVDDSSGETFFWSFGKL